MLTAGWFSWAGAERLAAGAGHVAGGAGADLHQPAGADRAHRLGLELRFLQRVGEDQRLVDPPAPGRPPGGRRVAVVRREAAAARAVVRQVHLGGGEVESRGEVDQRLVLARVPDPGLVADEVGGALRLADLGERDRGADVAPLAERSPVLGV